MSSSSGWDPPCGLAATSAPDSQRNAITRGFRRGLTATRINDRSDQNTRRAQALRRVRYISRWGWFVSVREIIALVSLVLLHLTFCANWWPSILP